MALSLPSLLPLLATVAMSRETSAFTLTMSSNTAVVVGLNSALQKRFVLDPSSNPNLVPGSVHRAVRVEEGVGGKGQDVAVSLSVLWEERDMPLALAQFVGSGGEGDAVMGLLGEMLGGGDDDDDEEGDGGGEGRGRWASLTVRPKSGLRTCTTIVGADGSTELVEPSGIIEPEEMDDLLNRMDEMTKGDNGDGGAGAGAGAGAGGLCVMGSMPPGCPDGTYGDICDRVADRDTVCVIDTVAGLGPLLASLASKRASDAEGEEGRGGGGGGGGGGGVNVFKVNASELCRLASVTKGSGGEADRITEDELTAAVEGFLDGYDGARAALDYLAVTDGRHPANLVRVGGGREGATTTTSITRLGVVDLTAATNDDDNDDDDDGEERLLYPIGAGDTVAAGTLAALMHHRKRNSALRGRAAEALDERRDALLAAGSADAEAASAFAFGLACGSASCLRRENSVFDLEDALDLYARAAAAAAAAESG